MNQDVTHSQYSSHLQLATTAEKHHITTDYPESDVYGGTSQSQSTVMYLFGRYLDAITEVELCYHVFAEVK